MGKIIGYYNELEYRIELDGKEIYTASNSPFDSQAYTSAGEGVGLATMRKYCIQTSKELAKENKTRYIGVQYLETD